MINQRLSFFIVLCLLILGACTSTTDLANELFEAGDYDSAIRMYNKALKEDPEDNEAKIGLFKTRKQWINTQLISVRKARLAQNYQAAIELMQEIFDNQSRWDMSPQAAAFATQKQEAELLSEYLTKKIRSQIKDHPIAANKFIKQHQKFYESPGRSMTLRNLTKQTHDSGVSHCKKLQKSVKTHYPYYTMFTNQYCSYWGVTTGQKDIDTLTAQSPDAFSEVTIDGEIDGIDSRSRALIVSNVQNALERSPWFNSNSKRTISAKLSGQFTQSYKREPRTIHEPYTVKIPYTAYEDRQESYKEPYIAVEHVSDEKGNVTTKHVTRYRTKYKTVQVPVTRYRKEGRTQTISGHHYDQALMLSGGLKLKLGGKSLSVPINSQFTTSGISHDTSMPEIGISPKPDLSVEPMEWLQKSLRSTSSDFQVALNKEWVNRYCPESFNSSSMVSFVDNVYKCNASSRARIGQEINNWFKKRHGLSFVALLEEVNKKDTLEGEFAKAGPKRFIRK